MTVVRTYEEQVRGAQLEDVSIGDIDSARAMSALLAQHAISATGVHLSADLISRSAHEQRIIEVKGRGGMADVEIFERQHETFRVAADLAWLYVVYNTTQPQPVELWLLPNPFHLPWRESQAALRSKGHARGTRHEAKLKLNWDDTRQLGLRAELVGLSLPSWAGASRD